MIALGADHGGYEIKEAVKKYLEENGIEYKDFGTYSTDSVDYQDTLIQLLKLFLLRNVSLVYFVAGQESEFLLQQIRLRE